MILQTPEGTFRCVSSLTWEPTTLPIRNEFGNFWTKEIYSKRGSAVCQRKSRHPGSSREVSVSKYTNMLGLLSSDLVLTLADNQPGFVQQRCLCTGLMLSVQEEPCSANDTGGKPSLSSQVGPEHEQCTSDVLPGVQCAPPESASADSLNINKTFYPSENLRKPVLAGNHDPQHCSSLPTSVPTQFPDHGAYCQTLFGCTLLGSLVKVNALSEFIDPYGTIARLPLEQVWSAPSVCLRELSSFAGQLAYACAVGESLAWAANQQLSP